MLCEADFRRPQGLERLVQAIESPDLPPMRLMEVCGTHTAEIHRNGIPAQECGSCCPPRCS